MKKIPVENHAPREIHLSARGVTVKFPKREEAVNQTAAGPQPGFKPGVIDVEPEVLGAFGADPSARAHFDAGHLKFRGDWPPAPPPIVEAPAAPVTERPQGMIAAAQDAVAATQKQNQELRDLNQGLMADNAKLAEANKALSAENASLKAELAKAKKPAS